MAFHKLKVSALDNPIDQALTITLEVPLNLHEAFNYFPGQHLIFRLNLNGEELRRCYSLNSSPYKNEQLQVTVKRVNGGQVSNYLADHLKEGDELDVMIPQGRFYANPKKEDYKSYFLFAAGSGITPIISILKSILVVSPNSIVHLLYGNTNQDSIIFKKELDDLQSLYPQRLKVVHTLSKPKVWSSWEQWKGRKGRVNPDTVEWFIENHPPIAQSTEYYMCGPGAMNSTIRKTLMGLQIPNELIFNEQFGSNEKEQNSEFETYENAMLEVSFNGTKNEFKIPKGKTILQVLKNGNIDVPYSCESGVCGTCVAKLTSGKAKMKSCMALSEDEINKGMILTCQSYPTSESIKIEYSVSK